MTGKKDAPAQVVTGPAWVKLVSLILKWLFGVVAGTVVKDLWKDLKQWIVRKLTAYRERFAYRVAGIPDAPTCTRKEHKARALAVGEALARVTPKMLTGIKIRKNSATELMRILEWDRRLIEKIARRVRTKKEYTRRTTDTKRIFLEYQTHVLMYLNMLYSGVDDMCNDDIDRLRNEVERCIRNEL